VKSSSEQWLARIFAGVFGAFLGLALLKFGDPPIMEKYVTAPSGFWEFLIATPWPIHWAYSLLLGVSLLGICAARWRPAAPLWLLVLPILWLAWQVVAATQSIKPELSRPTVWHFASCVVCFYLGLVSLRRGRLSFAFWGVLLCAFLLVLAAGWEQRLGGLSETRRYFFAYIYPQMKDIPAEYLKRLTSNRIFSTLFYPNALAGGLLLLLPAVLATVWNLRERFTLGARQFLVAVIAVAALACLYWSGSKGGWLLMLLLGLIASLRFPLARKIKLTLVGAILVAGLAGFLLKYAGFFERGATSVSARFDYWRVALRIAEQKPLFGCGPGTFAVPYQRMKRPDSESARLVHDDYLEQATDSGILGAAAYTVFIAGSLVWSFRNRLEDRPAQATGGSSNKTLGAKPIS